MSHKFPLPQKQLFELLETRATLCFKYLSLSGRITNYSFICEEQLEYLEN